MKVITITKEQRNKLCDELARIIIEFRNNRNVKCIYFTPYVDDNEGNVIEITVVRELEDDFDEKFKDYNVSHLSKETMSAYGVKIYLDSDIANKYTIIDLNPSEFKRSNFLMNSTILYDGSGEFTKIKEQTAKTVKNDGEIPGVFYYYDNLAQIFPPLDEALDRAVDNARLERDTAAVREFTRSRLFKETKDM